MKTIEFDKVKCEEIVSLRDSHGRKWPEISEAMGIPAGKCILMYEWIKVPAKARIKNVTPEQVVQLRKEGESWGSISAMTSVSESSLRTMYESSTGKSSVGNRIGKGGRYPSNATKPAKAEAPAKKTAKKAPAKKAPAVNGVLLEMEDGKIAEALAGRAIKVATDTGEEVLKVSSVKRVTKNTVVVAIHDGSSRTIKRASVFQISKKKVL